MRGIVVDVGAGIAVVNTLNLRYDGDPPDEIEDLDLTLRSGLRLAF